MHVYQESTQNISTLFCRSYKNLNFKSYATISPSSTVMVRAPKTMTKSLDLYYISIKYDY